MASNNNSFVPLITGSILPGASRINKYQDDIKKFIKNRSILKKYPLLLDIIDDLYNDSDFYLSIFFLTIINNQNKKFKISIHGYHMACGIEFLNLLYKLNDNKEYYMSKYGDKYKSIISELSLCVKLSLQNNIELIKKMEINKKLVKIIKITTSMLDIVINEINTESTFTKLTNKKNDLLTYNFNFETKINYINIINNINRVNIIEYTKNKYSLIGQIAILFGWIIGFGDNESQKIQLLQKNSIYLGYLLKIVNDFKNIKYDILNINNNHTNNIIINNGIQASCELYFLSKEKVMEMFINFDLYTNSIKDILTLLDNCIDINIEYTNTDLLSSTICSTVSNSNTSNIISTKNV